MIKRIMLITFILVILFLWGCKVQEPNLSNDNITRLDKEIQSLIDIQLKALKERNIETYIATLDASQKEYIHERKSWFRDIVNNNINNVNIKVLQTSRIDKNVVLAKLKQQYNYNGKDYGLVYVNTYIKKDDKWLDGDLYFESIENKNFIIKYPRGYKEIGILALEGAQKAYDDITRKTSLKLMDKTVVKIYNDRELLRQSVKLSFPWQFAGWYEYPESIKTSLYSSERVYKSIIEHELVHKLTISESNNNLPYWFSEGLAVYYTEYYNLDFEKLDIENLSWILDIKELEKLNIEKMTDNNKISNYYSSSGLIVWYMNRKFGSEKIIKIIKELGKYPLAEGTGGEIDDLCKERFEEVLPKVLGITVYELNQMFIEWLKDNK